VKAPLVSVLIPTFNRKDVLGLAIESALAQTVTDIEVLVSGDGCTDGTGDVVQSYRDPRVVWHDWPKAPGFGYANRNRSLRQARGTFIAYLSHDDLWLPDHLERLTSLLTATGAEWAYSQPIAVTRSGRISPKVFDLRDAPTRRLWRERHIGYVSITHVVHRRSCLDDHGYWNERVPKGGDWELWMRILDGGDWRRFAFDPMPTSLHFVASWHPTHNWRRRVLARVEAWERPGAPQLRVAVPPGVTEQEAVCREMARSPDEWVAGLRRGVARELQGGGILARPLSTVLDILRRYRRRLTARAVRWPPYAA